MPAGTGTETTQADPVARRSPALCRFFGMVMERSMRRGFHAVRLAGAGWPELPAGRPAIVYLNHPSWWDPAFLIVMGTTRFADRPGFGPIDADALRRYPFLGRIGLFGIERSRRGAALFLRTARAVLKDPRNMLWITAEGGFTDPRARPVVLRPGLAHLVRHEPDAVVVPLALEYPFWDERTPEALARFGEPMDGRDLHHLAVGALNARLAERLEATMDALAADSMSRDPARFRRLVAGTAGVGGVYDLWRRAKAAIGGQSFQASHGAPER